MSYKYLFPFSEVDKHSTILIYGGGAVGRQFLRQIISLNYCKCSFLVDKNSEKLREVFGIQCITPEKIAGCQYDKIVIASTTHIDEIYDSLRILNIPEDKIVRKVTVADKKEMDMSNYCIDLSIIRPDHIFKSPPMDNQLMEAIHLISPHLTTLPCNDIGHSIWESDQNISCWLEYECLWEILSNLVKPMSILEIGPGLGRSLVFFYKKLKWQDCDIHVYDGDGETTKYTISGPRFEDSFCGNLTQLKRVLEYNGISNVTIHDAKQVAYRDIPAPFDLVYGFYNIGFHWALEHFLDDILTLIGKSGTAIFTVPYNFQTFARLQELPYQIFEKRRVDNKREKLLVLGPISALEV